MSVFTDDGTASAVRSGYILNLLYSSKSDTQCAHVQQQIEQS
jgi:hypothetical protein